MYYLSSRTSFEIDLGPYTRVQNVDELIKYRNASKANQNWVYSPEEGPFRALGQERINKILSEQSNRDPILRLNDATSKLAREIFNQLKSSLINNNSPPLLPVCKKPALNITTIYDSQGITALSHCIQKILNDKADFSAIDRFLSLGGNLNDPIRLYYTGALLEVPPLTYLWCSLSNAEPFDKKVIELIDYLFKCGADLNYTFGPNADNIISVIMHTAPPPLTHMLPWYLKNGGDINFKNMKGDTLLHLALFNPGWAPANDLSSATKLIENEIDVSLGNNQGDHPIHLLCRYGYNDEPNNALLETILKKAPGELNVKDGNQHTSLYWSIRTGKLRFVNTIAKAKPDIPSTDAKIYLEGFAAFMNENSRKTTWGDHGEIFTKASIEENLRKNYIPLLNSIIPFVVGTREGLRALLIASEGQTTLLHHFAGSCPWILDHLLQDKYILPEDLQLKNGEGISVEVLGNLTNTNFSMMIACYNLDVKSAKELITKDFSLDFSIKDGNSFLHTIINGHTVDNPNEKKPNDWQIGFKIFEMLLAKGVNSNLQNTKGETALLWAIGAQTREVNPYILELVDYGADVDLADNSGMTARKRICEFRDWTIAKQAILGAPHK